MNVLELGAGTGFLSLLCARYLNTHYVLATDGSDEIVRGIRSSLDLNELSGSPTFKTAVLRWGDALTDSLFSFDNEQGEVMFDLVIGADLVGTCSHISIAHTSLVTCRSMYVAFYHVTGCSKACRNTFPSHAGP